MVTAAEREHVAADGAPGQTLDLHARGLTWAQHAAAGNAARAQAPLETCAQFVPVPSRDPSACWCRSRGRGRPSWCRSGTVGFSSPRSPFAGYLGKTNKFDQAIADFAETHADLNERDHPQRAAAIDSGRKGAQSGL